MADLRRSQMRRWPRAVLAFVIGVVLLWVAVRVVLHEHQTLRSGLAALQGAPAWQIAMLIALPILNLIFASGSFWVLTNRHGRVPYSEMIGLIGSAWLLNHLPLRPGMIGRVAYHKLVHRIPIRASLAVLLSALICAAAGMGMLLLLAIIIHALQPSTTVRLVVLGGPVLAGGLVAAALKRSRFAARQLWRYPAAIVFRYLDVCCWTARYAVVFALLGRPVTMDVAAGLALSSQAAMLSPVQLGLREWVVGLAASVMTHPVGPAAAAEADLPQSVSDLAPGLLADMVNRSAELSVAIPIGLVSTVVLYRRYRRARAAQLTLRPVLANPKPSESL